MSTVDTKIVQARFDNTGFKEKVAQTLDSLTKFEKKTDNLGKNSGKSLNGFTGSMAGMEKAISAIQSRFSTMGIIGMTVIQNLTNSAVNAAKKITSQMVTGGKQRALNIEQASFMLEGLLGKTENGAQKIKDIMGAANEAVTGTAYGFDEAAKVASQLVASGIEDSKQMEGYLKGIAGAAAMTGGSFAEIGDIFTTVAGNGKLMTEQLRQFSARGLNAAATLRDYFKDVRGETGMTEEKIRDMVSKGKIDFQTFADAMEWAFGEQAKKANETFTGSLSNMKAAINRIGADIWTPLLKNARDVFNAVTPLVNNFRKALGRVKEEGKDEYFIGFMRSIHVIMDEVSKTLVEILGNWTELMDKVTFDPFKNLSENRLRKVVRDIISIFMNLGIALKSIISPISEAFGSVFRVHFGSMAKNMATLIARIKMFTESLKLSSNQANNLYRVFRLIFQVAAHVFMTLKTVFVSLKNIIGQVGSAIKDGFLSVFAKDSSLLTGLTSFVGSIHKGLSAITGFAKNLKLSESQMRSITNIATAFFSVLKTGWGIVTGVARVLLSLAQVLLPIGDAALSAAGGIGGLISNIAKSVNIHDKLILLGEGLDYVFGIIKSGSAAIKSGLGNVFGKALDSLKKFVEYAKSVIPPIDTSFRNLAELGFGLLTGSMVALAIKSESFKDVITKAINMVKVNLTNNLKALQRVLNNLQGVLKAFTLNIKADALWKIAKAIALLAASLFLLSSIDSERMISSIGAITVLFSELAIITRYLTGFGFNPKTAFAISQASSALLKMSAAVLVLSFAMKTLSSISWNGIAKGLVSVTALMAILVATTKILSSHSTKKMTKGITSLITMAIAIRIMASSMKALSGISWNGIAKGLGSITVLMGEMLLLSKFAGDKATMRFGASMILMSTAIIILSKAVKSFAGMDVDSLVQGISSVGALMGLFAVMSHVISDKGMMSLGASMILMGVAMKSLTKTIKELGGLDVEVLARGVGTLATVLIGLAIAANAMKGTAGSGAAMILMAVGLAAITSVIKKMGSLDLGTILKGLVGLAGAFVVIGYAASIMSAAEIPLLGFAGALALIGVASLAFGAGLMLAGIGLASLVSAVRVGVEVVKESFDVLLDALTKTLKRVIKLLPELLEAVAEGIARFASTLASHAPEIIGSIADMLLVALDKLQVIVPKLANLIVTIIGEVLSLVSTRASEFVDKLITIFIAVVNGLAARMPEIVTALTNMVSALVGALFQTMGEVINTLLPTLASAIQTTLPVIGDVFVKVIEAITPLVPVITDAIVAIINAIAPLMPNINSIISELAPVVMKFIDAFVAVAQQIAPILEQIKGIVEGAFNGIASIIDSVGNAISSTIEAMADAISSYFEGMADVIDSIGGTISDVVNAIGDSVSGVLDSIAGIFDSIGDAALNAGKGFDMLSKGIKRLTDLKLGDMVATLKETASGISDIAKSADTNALVDMGQGFSKLGNGIQDVATYGRIAGAVFPLVGAGLELIGSVITGLPKAMSTCATAVQTFATSMSTTSVALLGSLVGFVSVGQAIIKMNSSMMMLSVASALVTTFMGIIQNKTNTAATSFGRVSSAATSAAARLSVISTAATSAGAGLSRLSTMAASAMTKMASAVSSGKAKVVNAAKSAVSQMISAVNSSLGPMTAKGRDAANKFATGIKSGVSVVQSAARNIALAAGSAASSASYSGMYNAGRQAGFGFKSGLDSTLSSIRNSVRSMASIAVKTLTYTLQVHSPSRVMQKIGSHTGEGFALGINNSDSSVRVASVNLANTAIDSIGKAISSVTDYVNEAFNTDANPVISPIVDLTNVRASAASINSMFGYQAVSPYTTTRMASRVGGHSSVRNPNRIVKNESNTTNTFNITVDGAENPEAFADRLVRQFQLRGRMA